MFLLCGSYIYYIKQLSSAGYAPVLDPNQQQKGVLNMFGKLTLAVLVTMSSLSHLHADGLVDEKNTGAGAAPRKQLVNNDVLKQEEADKNKKEQTWGQWFYEKAVQIVPSIATEQLENFREPIVNFAKNYAEKNFISSFSEFTNEKRLKDEIIGKMNLSVSYAEMMYSLFSGDKTWEDAYKKVSTTFNTMLIEGVDVARDNAEWYANVGLSVLKYGADIVTGLSLTKDKEEFLKEKVLAIALEQLGRYGLSGLKNTVEGAAFACGGYLGWVLVKASIPVIEKAVAPLVVPAVKTVVPVITQNVYEGLASIYNSESLKTVGTTAYSALGAVGTATYNAGSYAVNTVYNTGSWLYGKVFG